MRWLLAFRNSRSYRSAAAWCADRHAARSASAAAPKSTTGDIRDVSITDLPQLTLPNALPLSRERRCHATAHTPYVATARRLQRRVRRHAIHGQQDSTSWSVIRRQVPRWRDMATPIASPTARPIGSHTPKLPVAAPTAVPMPTPRTSPTWIFRVGVRVGVVIGISKCSVRERLTDQHSTASRALSRIGIARTVSPGRSVAVRGYARRAHYT
jgi:hypothetical protein